MKRNKEWFNYVSVESLAEDWKLSKRRIQQIISKLRDEGKIEMIIGVFDSDTTPFARPLYRRVDS